MDASKNDVDDPNDSNKRQTETVKEKEIKNNEVIDRTKEVLMVRNTSGAVLAVSW